MDQPERIVIERLGHQGDGIARDAGGRPVYAARCLPGEVVEGRRVGDRLEDIRILDPSEVRVTPPCPHFRSCGGCALQHASDGFVADWKADNVRTALTAQGITAPIGAVENSPAQSRRRAVFAARRTKKGALVGFHGRASDVIVEIPQCQILDPALKPGLALAKDLAITGGSRKGALAVHVTASENGLDVAVRGGKELDGGMRAALADLARTYGLARMVWDDEVVAARLPAIQRFGGVTVEPPPGAFLQATREGEATLVSAVDEITSGAKRIADLFAGSGTFSLPLSRRAEIHAVESAGEMLKALDHGWRHGEGLRRITTETRDLFRRPLMPDELARFDAVVIDPPRAGALAQMTELARSGVAVIAAVSCNPVSFARDAAILKSAGYCLDWVRVVDQFRWSTHVELAASFSLSHMGRGKAGELA